VGGLLLCPVVGARVGAPTDSESDPSEETPSSNGEEELGKILSRETDYQDMVVFL